MTTYWRPKTNLNATNLSELTTIYDTQSCPRGIINYAELESNITSGNLDQTATKRIDLLTLDPTVYDGRVWRVCFNYKSVIGNGILELWANGTRASETYIYSTTTYNVNWAVYSDDWARYNRRWHLATGKINKYFSDGTEDVDGGILEVGIAYTFVVTIRPTARWVNEDIIFDISNSGKVQFYIEDMGTI